MADPSRRHAGVQVRAGGVAEGQLPGAEHPGTACSPPLPPHKEVTQIDSELC